MTNAGPTTVLSHAQEAAHASLMARIADHQDDGHHIPCRGAEGHLWLATNRAHQDQAAEACTWCPLLHACRGYATTYQEPSGIWGGTTPTSRAHHHRTTKTTRSAA